MTQPRKEQVKSVNTRRVVFPITVSPGSSSSTISDAQINPYLVTDLPGGSEEPIPAYVIGTTSDPFPIVAGDAISIAVDSSPPVTVTFGSPDTTATKVAVRINTTVGLPSTLVQTMAGSLGLVSTTVGSSSKIILADVVPGSLAKIGLTAGTYVGGSGPVRGAVTKSADLLGGMVVLRGPEGRNILTECPSVRTTGSNGLSIGRRPTVPGGFPIYGRLSRVGSNYRLRYHASLPPQASVTSFNGNLALLDNTDTVDITVDGGSPITVTFPSGPGLTPTQVVDRINEIWGNDKADSVGKGQANVIGLVSQPFTFSAGGEPVTVSIDGAGPLVVNLNNTHVTAQDVANAMNGVFGAAATASRVTIGNSTFLKVVSNNLNGRTSSIDFSGWPFSALTKLGIVPGVYRGAWVAEPSGSSEIKIASIRRGSGASVVISSANPTTLTRLGIAAQTVNGSDTLVPEPVVMPRMTLNPPTTSYAVKCLIPEAIDFGEINPASESIDGAFEESSPGTYLTRDLLSGHYIFSQAIHFPFSGGLYDIGRPVFIGPDGTIDKVLLRGAATELNNLLRQVIRGDFSLPTASALVTNVLETGGYGGNPAPDSKTLEIRVDPNNVFSGDNAREFSVTWGLATKPFKIQPNTAGGTKGWHVTATNGSFRCAEALTLSDPNIEASGGELPLSSATSTQGDRFVRVFEQEAIPALVPGQTLLKKVNAQWAVTVGDGVATFGDFNGPGAIQSALTFFASNTAFSICRIQCKRGTYEVSASTGSLTVPTNKTVILEGIGAIIMNTDSTTLLNMGTDAKLVIRDMNVVKTVAPFGVLNVGIRGVLEASGVLFLNVGIEGRDPTSYLMNNCQFSNGNDSADRACVTVKLGDGTASHGPFTAVDCSFTSGKNHPVLRISATTSVSAFTTATLFAFRSCQMNLQTTTVVSDRMNGNCGVLDLDPNGSDASAGATGINVRHVLFKDCDVRANVVAGAVSCLMHLQPQANGLAVGTGYASIVRLTIEGGRWTAPGINTTFSPFMVADVGGASFGGSPVTFGGDRGGTFIHDVRMGFDGSASGINMGAVTSDSLEWFAGASGDSLPQSTWGAFAIAGRYVEIRDVNLDNMSQLGSSGDLFVRWQELVMENVTLASYVLGGPGTPTQRVRFRSYPNQVANCFTRIRGLRLLGKVATSGDWTASYGTGGGVVAIEPWSSVGQPSLNQSFKMEDCQISGFAAASSVNVAGAGIYTQTLLVADQLYTNNPTRMPNLIVRGCKIAKVELGIAVLASAQGQSSSTHVYEGNDIRTCTSNGIAFVAQLGQNWDTVAIRNNVVTGCGANGSVPGIFVATDDPSAKQAMITNNYCCGNNSSNTAAQIRYQILITASTPANSKPRAVITGNTCEFSGTVGSIQINSANAVPAAVAIPDGAVATSLPTNFRVVGVETEYNGSASADIKNREYNSGDYMIHNLATLLTP